MARGNLEAFGLDGRAEIRVASWAQGLEGPFDLIVSNPPYIASAEIDALPPVVRDFDPRLALDGGADGLDAYRAILPAAVQLLAPGGAMMVEVGAGQEHGVRALASHRRLHRCLDAARPRRDRAGGRRAPASMTGFARFLIAAALAAVAGGRVAADPVEPKRDWPQEKCFRYTRDWNDALRRFGQNGLSAGFLTGNAEFIRAGCRPFRMICPSTPKDRDLVDALAIRVVNEGMSTTFLPFDCPHRNAAP